MYDFYDLRLIRFLIFSIFDFLSEANPSFVKIRAIRGKNRFKRVCLLNWGDGTADDTDLRD